MTSYDNMIEQLQTLTKKVEDLEASNSSILKILNERSERSHDTVTAELQSTLKSLKTQSGKKNDELNVLKEHLTKLNDHVAKLSSTVHNLDSNLSVLSKRGSLKSNDKLATCSTSPNHLEETSRTKSLIPNISTGSPSTDKQSKIPETSEQPTETSTEGFDERDRYVKPERPALRKNKFGLKCRTVCSDDDNRLRLLEGNAATASSEVSQPWTTSSSNEKLNLPTRHELEKLVRTRKEERKLQQSKQVTHNPNLLKNPFKNLAGLNKDPDNAPDVKDLNTWRSLAESEKRRGQTEVYLNKGKGPDTCLLLDISGSMAGEPFNEMMEAVMSFINGIAVVAAALGIEENIGIATFGEQTRVIQHLTNEYDQVIKTLDSLYPSGPSPMAAGLYMALACCMGNTASSSVQGVQFHSRIIMFTDGRGTLDNRTTGDDDFDSSLESNVLRCAWLSETAEDLARRSIRVYAVPIGDSESSSLETVCGITHGKMYTGNEIPKLVRMTQTSVTAIELVRNGLDFDENMEKSEIAVHRAMHGENWEELSQLGRFYSSQELSMFKEINDNLPPIGSRVRRGPDWTYPDQDQGGAGTVVGHDDNMVSVWVEWDCGHKNVYRFLSFIGQDVVLVDEPRILIGERIAVGCKVERGKDWKYGNRDGGAGSIGVVIKAKSSGNVIVRWPNKNKGTYKFGFNGLFEVKLCDQAKSDEGRYIPETSFTHTRRNPPSDIEISSGKPIEYDLQKHSENGRSSEGHKEAKKPLSLEELNERNRQKQLKEQSEMEKITWTYKKEGDWHVFPNDINDKMEKAYGRNKHGSMILEVDGYTWRASFSDMKMTCQKTHAVVDIERNVVDH